MTTLTEKMEVLEDQLASQNAVIAAYIDTVEEKLQLINDNLSVLQENGAANTKALLAAMGQSAACFPCPTPSILVPPTITTPIGIDEDKCKRSQAFVATMHAILDAMDTMQSFNVIGTYNVVSDAIGQVVGGIISGDSPPLPSFPEAVNIVGDYVSYAGERVFSGVGLIEQFSPLEDAIRDALYLSSDASTAKSSYDGVVNGSDASNGAKLLFVATAYNALYSYFFDPGTSPDLSGFSGTACGAPTDCVTLLTDYSFTMTKTESNGLNWTWFEIPSWAVRVIWDVTFSDGFNVLWGPDNFPDGSPATGAWNVQGFFSHAANEWTHDENATTFWGVGGFFDGLPNGTTRDIVINSLVACPTV